MRIKCAIGIHEWSGCRCAKCGKTRDEGHDWSQDCEMCKNCNQTRSEAHALSGCKCATCGSYKHKWYDFSCSLCGQLDHRGIIEEVYRIGHKCEIVGFIPRSSGQDVIESLEHYIATLRKCNNDSEQWEFVAERYDYLARVVRQMLNPPIYDRDVEHLNQIGSALKKAQRQRKQKP